MRVLPYSNMLLGALVIAALLCFFFALYYYGTAPGYLDHVEPGLTLLSWGLINGQPLYTLPDSLDYSVNTYGPAHYIVQSIILTLIEPSIANSKIIILSASGFAVLLFGIHIWRRYGYPLMVIGVVLLTAIILRQAPSSFSVRPDLLILLLITVAVVVKDFDRAGVYWPVLLVAVCIGIAVNVKIYAPVFFFPILILLVLGRKTRLDRIRVCVIVGTVTTVVAGLPFLSSNISVIAYLKTTYELVTVRERSFDSILPLVKNLAIYLSPVVLLLFLNPIAHSKTGRKNLIYFFSLLLVSFAIMYPASMPGAGRHHLIPMAPIAADLYVRMTKETFKHAAKLGHSYVYLILPLAILLISVPSQKRLFRQVTYLHNSTVPNEIEKLLIQQKNAIVMMGYGDNFESYKLSYFEPMLVFAGNPTRMSALSLMELHASGIKPPNNLDKLLSRCNAHIWLIPKGEIPFKIASYYDGKKMVYSDNFRRNFLSFYHNTGDTRSFDIWTCNN